MPTILHEALLYLFRQRPSLAPQLLRQVLGERLPRYSQIQVDSENLADLKPARSEADLVVLLLGRREKTVHGIVVEAQLSKDVDKPFTWPAYAANLRLWHRVPVSVLVLAANGAVARWAARPIPIGGGNFFAPQVLSPAGVPVVTDPEEARRAPALAVFSAMSHGRGRDIPTAARAARAALAACLDLDTPEGRMYCDLILASMSEAARRKLQAMDPETYEYQSEFAKRYVAQGERKGREEGTREGELRGRVELVIRLLTVRFGPLPDDVPVYLSGASLEELDTIGERLLSARTVNEALGR